MAAAATVGRVPFPNCKKEAGACASLPFPLFGKLLLLAGDRLCRTLAGAGIGVRALTAHRQAATMAKTAIAAKIHQTLDVHRGLATQVALNLIVAVDRFTDLKDFSIRQLMHTTFGRNTNLFDDFLCEFRADPVNIRQRDDDALCGRDVDASDTCHVYSPCVPVAIRQ
ncbi:conserved hypothetical protein [Sinorhizobium medicae]|uniref:Uncharacterized protein n=1 Tax=Sinorhizobium medicae TaxID=110321 RepID=A0A508WUM8_9HYPH|nr:conserved hypothetical protein [Sinorhizobium medicae]